jgi:hypothetical protein
MARSNAVMKRTSVGSGKTAVHTWADIANVESPVILDCTKLSPAMVDRLTDHGCYAKVGDSAAKSDATTAEKFAAMRKTVAAIMSDEWRGERESSDLDLIEAFVELNPKKSRDEIVELLKKSTVAEKSLLRIQPAVKKVLDRNAAAAVKKSGIDPAALLAKFIHGGV